MKLASQNIHTESKAAKVSLILIAVCYIILFLVIPLVFIFSQALAKGIASYWAAVTDPETLAALRLTLLTVAIVIPINLLFGLAAAWAISHFKFWGKSILLALIDIPFAVSPVIAGLIYILVYGLHGWFGPWLEAHHFKIIFAFPGIILVSIFVTFPLIARELIPLMQANGSEEEEAAVVLGATAWQMFFRITLPNIKWGLVYGVALCSARAVGEFGAVSVVSGHIRGGTITLPLHIEILYNEYNFTAAFAVASLLAIFAIITLLIKLMLENESDPPVSHIQAANILAVKENLACVGYLQTRNHPQ